MPGALPLNHEVDTNNHSGTQIAHQQGRAQAQRDRSQSNGQPPALTGDIASHKALEVITRVKDKLTGRDFPIVSWGCSSNFSPEEDCRTQKVCGAKKFGKKFVRRKSLAQEGRSKFAQTLVDFMVL